jgi:hypothetical protein
MSNVKTSVKVVISIFLLSIALSESHAQAQISPISRRQQFNLFRQLQLQRTQPVTEQQEDGVIERQSEPQLAQVSKGRISREEQVGRDF